METTGIYFAEYKPGQLLYGSGHTVVVTGWTISETIAKRLESHEYAVIGQLYSAARGISFLVRNLLLNPQVQYVVLIAATTEDSNAGSCRCFHDFFVHGFEAGIDDAGHPTWLIRSEIKGFIDFEITAEALETLRQSILCFYHDERGAAIERVHALACMFPEKPETGRSRLKFPVRQLASNILPGQLYGHRIEGETIAQAWVKILHRIRTTGVVRPNQHDGQWQELIDVMAVVTDEPDGFDFPEPNYLPVDRAFIRDYLAQILADATGSDGVKYTYGQRLRSEFGVDQIEQVIQKLCDDPNSARAVMSLWDVQHDPDAKNPPCLNHIWVRVLDGVFSLTAVFRSNDMFSAWVANAMGLRALQRHVWDEVTRRSGQTFKLGALIILSESAHLYDESFEAADAIVKTHYQQLIRAETKRYFDPCGDYLIQVSGEELLVERSYPKGSTVASYRGKPQEIVRAIIQDAPGLQPDHAAYLGMELQRAYQAVQQGKPYVQDRS
jgi:thymidylate synthase